MGNNSDQFILEISAKIKNDSAQLIKELRSELSKVEKETKLSISIDEKKTKEYIGKLKQSMNQVSTELKKANVDISSYNKFISVLKEGAEYSKTIADSLKQANNIAKNFTELESVTTGKKDKQKSIRENKNIVKAEFGVLKKQIAQIEKEANGLTKNKTFKKNLASISEILKNPFDHKNVDFSSYKAVQKYINDIYKQVKNIRTEWSLISDEQIANKNDYVKNNTGKLNGIVKGFKDNSSLLNIDKYKDDFIKMKSLAEQYDLKLKEIGNSSDIAFDITDLKQIEQEFDKLFSKLNSYDDNTINILDSKLNKKTISDELKKIADKDLDKDSTILSYKLDENFNNGIIKLTTDIKKADGEIQKLVYSYDSANGAVKKLTESNKEFVNISKQVSTSFTGSFKDMVRVMTVGLGIEDVIHKLKEGLTLVKDLDTALTEMNKVSNESFSNLQKYAMGSFDEAGLIGTTGLDLQSSTADWMRLGKSMSDAQQLAKDTNVLFNVSEFSNIDAATESMVSMTQAYQEISSNDIVDKLNLVGNNYSMATDELAYSLQRSASALKTAKNDFDEAIALTVAGNSVVQNPEMVAAGVRTISLRMAGTSVAKQELESLGEETDTFLTKSKLNDTLEKLTNIDERGGISLLDDNGNYRSTAKVLMDLADRWAEIEAKDKQDGQNRQNALLEALAGKNRASILASILNDKDLLKTVYEDVSTNFDDSALEENAKQMESIEGHLTQLKNKWQEFWASEGNREFITDILDLAQGIIDLTNALGGANVVIPLFFLAWSQGEFELITKGLTGIVTILREIATFGKSTTLTKAMQSLIMPLKNEGENWKGIFAGDIGKELAEDVVDDLNDNKSIIQNGAQEVFEDGMEKGAKNIGKKSGSIIGNILKFIKTPIGAGIAIAGTAIIAQSIYKKHEEEIKKASERADNAVADYKNNIKQLSSFGSNIPNLSEEYDRLRKGVSSTGENLSLTNDEFARYHEITNQIAEQFPSLISGYDSTGNAIVNMTNSLTEMNEAFKIQSQKLAFDSLRQSPLSDQQKAIEKLSKDNRRGVFNTNTEYDETVKHLAFDKNTYAKLMKTYENKINLQDEKGNMLASTLLGLESSTLKESVANYQAEFDQMKSRLITQAQTTDAYYELEEKNRVLLDSMIMNFSETDYDKYSNVVGILTLVKEFEKYTSENQDLINKLSNYESLFDGTTISKANEQINNLVGQFSKGSGLSEDTIRNSLGLNEINHEELYADVKNSLNKIDTSKVINIFKSKILELNKEGNVLKKSLDESSLGIENVVFGNVDLNDRKVLEWTDKTKEKYKDALKSMNLDVELGSSSTVLGSWGTYGVDKIPIAFSPMLQTEEGAKLLDANTVDDYLNTVLEKATKDGVISNSEILKIDATGFEMNGQHIKGLIADIGSTAQSTAENMHSLGKDGAISQINNEVKELEEANRKIEQFDGFTTEFLEANFSKADLEKINQNISSFEDALLTNWQEKLYMYYNDFGTYVLDCLNLIKDKTPFYGGENKSFSQLTSDSTSYSSILAELNYLGNDNVKITSEMAETLKNYGNEFSNYIEQNGNDYIVKDITAIKKLIKEKQTFSAIDAANSRDTALKQYMEETDVLVELGDKYEELSNLGSEYADVILDEINASQKQMDVTKRNIQYYQQLEAQLIGTSNAFENYNKAVATDSMNNKYSTASTMMDTLQNGLKNGQVGTEAFKSAVEGMLSDDEYDKLMSIDNLDKRFETLKKKYNQLRKYFKTDSDGNISTNSIQNFINDGYKKKLFTSNDLNNFEVKDGVTMDDFVDKLGYSKETIYAIFEMIQNHNFDWGNTIFKGLVDDTTLGKLSVDLEEVTDKVNKYREKKKDALEKRSQYKEGSKEWNELSKEIEKCNKEIETYTKEQNSLKTGSDDSVASTVDEYLKNEREIKALESEIDLGLNGKADIDITEADKKLGKLLAKKKELGTPTTVQLKLAKEEYEKELEEKKNEKFQIESEIIPIIPSSILDQETIINAKIEAKEATKDVDKEISDIEQNIADINVALNIKAETDETYEATKEQVNKDKAEMEKDCKTPSISLNSTSFHQKAQEVEDVKNALERDTDSTHYQYTRYISIGDNDEDNDAIGKNNRIISARKKGVFTASDKSAMLITGGIKAFGNAFSIGSNSTNYSSGKTLVGEFGAETIVDPWSGRYRVVGLHGSELVNIPKDAIVYNHKQTEQLQKNNKINSRGKLITDASGFMKGFAKASPEGSAFAYVPKPSQRKNTSTATSNGSSSKSKNSSASDGTKSILENLFDWIEIRLERLSNKTQNWIALAENAISKSVQKTHYTSAINSTVSEISQTKTAYSKYMAQANALIKKSGVKNASAYAKKVREGSLSLQDISNEKLKDFISSYKEMYDKAVECDNAVISLTGELQELSQTLYNLPIEHAEKKIEKYSDKMDVLSAKYTNYRAYYTQNPALDEQLALQKSIKSAYASAYKETKSNLSSAKGKINNVNDSALKGLSASQKQKIISYVNEGKEINISNKYSANLKKALANYNAALEANRVASNEAAKASAEYTTMLRENNNAKYENITAYYEYKRSLDEANLSKLDAQIAYRESMGYSAVSKHSEGQKAVFDEMIKYNSDILKQLRQERSFYNDEKLMQMYENGELSREDYFALRSRIQEIDEAIYSTTTAINEARDEIYNLDIKRFDFIIDGVARAIEKFKNIISLKDSRNVDALESDYVSQNKGLISQIETLNKKREAILDEMKYYNVESDKYQELASNLQDVENEVYSKLTELEENKNAIMELRFKPLVDSVNELSEQISDLEHLRDLLSDYTLIDDKGAFTDSGLANILLIAKAIDNTNQQITDYRYALEMLEKNYNAGNLSQQEFTEQSREYVELIQDAVSSVDGYKDALIDLYEEQLKIENDALKESISLRKEALEKKKSYYDYDKTLKTSNKDIVNLKNQIAALEGVNNASAKAEVARLKAQLSEAEEELADTKYDHSIQLQLDGYDEMTKSADEMLNELLEDLKNNAQLQEQVVSNMLNNIVNTYDVAYSKIKDIINSTAVNNTTSNSLNTSGENIANSSTTSPTDRNPSYSGISSSTIESGNSNTANIESSITNGSLNETNRKVARITTSLTSVSLEVGKTQKLTCTVQPSDAQNKTLSVKSSNTGVATVSISGTNITITAKGKGSCTVTVYSNDGGASASVGVTVTAPVVTTPTTTTTKPKTTTTTSTSKTTTSTTTTTKPKTTTTSTKSSTKGYISSLSGNISKSSSSSTVKKVQKALKALGFKGKDGKALTIDGKWGTNTDYAVKSFQKSSKYGGKIKADGIIGKNTKAKFKKAGYFKGGIVDTVIDNATFLDMIRANRDDGLITAKLGEGIIPKNMMPDFTKQLEQFNSIPADKIMNSINTNSPSFEINVDKFMEVKGNVDSNCVNDLKSLENNIAKNITKTLTQEFRKLGYK